MLPGQSSAEEFSTLVHELAHEMLHKAERRTATTKTVRETEAEAVAFVVGKTIGLETAGHRRTTSTCTTATRPLLTESLEVIQKTSALILSAIENPPQQRERDEADPSPNWRKPANQFFPHEADGSGRPLQPPARSNRSRRAVMQNSSAFQYLAIDTIHESTTNPRRTFDEIKLQELAESISITASFSPSLFALTRKASS